MGTAIYFNVPSHGHVNPTLALVKELVDRGERIIYFNSEDFKGKIEKSGAEFRQYEPLKDAELSNIDGNLFKLVKIVLDATVNVMDKMMEETKAIKPDYIIHDSMCPWGKYIANYLGIKAVNTTTTFVFNKGTMSLGGNYRLKIVKMLLNLGLGSVLEINKMRRILSNKYGMKCNITDVLLNMEHLNLVFTSRYFQPDEFELNDSFKFVGPSIMKREDLKITFDEQKFEKRIYISLGTIMNDRIDFFRECIKAFTGQPFEVVIAVGNRIRIEDLGVLPFNVHVERYVSQLEVLNHADLFISHGGMNSVNESLYFGVPLLLFPQQPEQLMVARRVEELGAGICLDRATVRSEEIIDAVRKMINTSEYARQANKIRDTFREAGGSKAAVEHILRYVSHDSTFV